MCLDGWSCKLQSLRRNRACLGSAQHGPHVACNYNRRSVTNGAGAFVDRAGQLYRRYTATTVNQTMLRGSLSLVALTDLCPYAYPLSTFKAFFPCEIKADPLSLSLPPPPPLLPLPPTSLLAAT